MKYIIGLLAICFCLMLSVDIGAAPQHQSIEFVVSEAPQPCAVLMLDVAIRPVFVTEDSCQVPYSQPGESHGNLERSCISCDGLNYNYPSLQSEAPGIERYRYCANGAASVSAKEPDQDCLSDFKVGWQGLNA